MLDLPSSVYEEFDRCIDSTLERLTTAARLQEDLYRELPGLFPGEIAQRLRSRVANGCRESERLLALLEEGDVHQRARVRSDMVLPHPLDFEWLFTESCAASLANDLVQPQVSTVACVGTPSVYQALGRMNQSVTRLLADRPGVADKLRCVGGQNSVFHFGELSGVDVLADAAIVDSPWYPAHTVHFVSVAASLTRAGGRVLAVVPPPYTRPGVAREIQTIESRLQRMGVRLAGHLPSAVTYQAPPFEVSTLKALGLHGVSHEWRTGDLLEFVVTKRVTSCRELEVADAGSWEELRFSASRIKFKAGVDGVVPDPSLNSALAGDVLTSVSRRDPTRRRITVWTSGNRGFHCPSPNVLRIGFKAFMEERDPATACEEYLRMALPPTAAVALRKSIDRLVSCIQDEERGLEWC